ncbi:hypothetical protein GCM10009801_81660 [Streptomyces albiaxialis]|uniref:DUF8175 domain-containing protein n=1 Tax=Streptomyces albiaxialis TaxID=329523 RepID=A0ABN2X622_9ACTN
MSDGGDYGNERHPASRGGRLTTRTRLPDGEGGRTPTPRPGRSLITVVGVVVLLIAAIAFANRGGGDGGSDDGGGGGGSDRKPEAAQPTAPSGEKPVQSDPGKIPSGFSKSEQGAESAAANYAMALGGDGMFREDSRHEIVEAVAAPSALDKLQSGFDADYSRSLNKSIGLDEKGKAPSGSTFVNRTMPAGTDVKKYGSDKATVAVWCTGLFGVAGEKSTKPVTASWFTITFQLEWSDGDWKVTDSKQKKGPTPVTGDDPVSGADEISEAANEYGGFTYAR